MVSRMLKHDIWHERDPFEHNAVGLVRRREAMNDIRDVETTYLEQGGDRAVGILNRRKAMDNLLDKEINIEMAQHHTADYFRDHPESDEKVAKRIRMIDRALERRLRCDEHMLDGIDEQIEIALSAEADNGEPMNGYALVDSGCTCTIMKSDKMFEIYQPSSRVVGSAVGSVNMKAKGEGTVCLPVITTDGSTAIVEVAALHCPDARHDLLSLAGAFDGGWSATLKDQKGCLHSPDGRQVDLEYDVRRKL